MSGTPAAELQLEGVTGGDEEGMEEGGLEGDLEGSPSADTAAPESPASAGGLFVLCLHFCAFARCEGGSTQQLREAAVGRPKP